ncbi:Clavaminate synthase-like protein [Annulohypoxylon maeteangense]|uniref:Clavaminate synthase-like protein n=1 Tax=Annulohypoxylon maeteangense TaxID=1927788 RepID=UPI002007CEC6|nr:Clavaminate synthase-like protein [Annulohypoxylon maeteangense]KAI0880503.1 Clavaminate synthase-like protein [Annulohypoxylon maeteangense]
MATATYVTTPPALAPPGQPDISYHPDPAKYQARRDRRIKSGGLANSLPKGLPRQLTGKLVWEGDKLAETYEWTYVLEPNQLDEIDLAVKHFKSLGLSLGHISQQTFPLPRLHSELRRLSDELHNGHGFFVIRGLRVDEHSREENIIIYAGLSAHIAPKRGRQDKKFDGKPAAVTLSHIKDLSGPGNNAVIGSPAFTTDKQVFHTDSGDIVSLFALETAAEGGASKLASTWRVYNEIARTRPDLIHTLTGNWDIENFAERKFISRPLMYYQPATDSTPERVVLQYARRSLVGFGALPRSHNIPPITEAQAEALDTLHFLGEKFSVNTYFQKGDIQYVNNLALFHARDGFTNTAEKQRHLLRLWLRDPENAWETPEPLKWKWTQLYEGWSPEDEVFPLEPYIRTAGNKSG